jgi:glycerol-3-phosphate acyltransferase PlsX
VSAIVAVDAMGGDAAPAAVVAGAVEAAAQGIDVALVGAAGLIAAELARLHLRSSPHISVVDAPDAIVMDEAPLAALRRKPQASIRVAADLVARGDAHALFSAGHTGATFLAAHAALGLIDGVDRPALAVTVPVRGGDAVLVDAGANVDCRPAHLLQFAIMGAAFARLAFGCDPPRVGLLSIGEEATKGNDLTRDAHALLAASRLHFIGNLEAQAVFSGRADVIVCDGFTGNVALKVGEGLAEHIGAMLREALGASASADPDVTRLLEALMRRLDYAERGAAPLLGLTGLVLVGHGRSSTRAVANGIQMAARLASEGMVGKLTDEIRPKAR